MTRGLGIALAFLFVAAACSPSIRSPAPVAARVDAVGRGEPAARFDVPAAAQPAGDAEAAPSIAPAPESELYLVARGESLTALSLGESWLFQSSEDGLSLAELRDGAVLQDEPLRRGLESCSPTGAAFFGSFPDRAFAVTEFSPWAVRAPRGKLHRWSATRWVRAGIVDVHMIAIEPWLRDSALALEVPRRSGPPFGYRLRVLAGSPGRAAPLPATRKGTSVDGAPCYTRLEWPVAFRAFATGEVVVVGLNECGASRAAEDDDEDEPGASPAVVERFGRSARGSVLEPLPLSLPDSTGAAFDARGPGDIWVAGARLGDPDTWVVSHFDGATWKIVGAPLPDAPVSLADDGARLWIVVGGEKPSLWRSVPGSPWERVALPAEAGEPRRVVARGAGDVWVETLDGLYRTIAPPRPLEWRTRECTDAEWERFP